MGNLVHYRADRNLKQVELAQPPVDPLWGATSDRVLTPVSRGTLLAFFTLVAAAHLGASLAPIDLGCFHMFPFRALLVVQLVAIGIAIVRNRRHLRVLSPTRYYGMFLTLWVVYAAFSLTWVRDVGAGVRDLGLLVVGAALVLATVFCIRTFRHLRWLNTSWLVAYVALAFLGLWENITGLHLPRSSSYMAADPQLLFRPTGVFHNSNDYGMFIALALPFVLAAYVFASRATRSVGYFLLLALGTYVLLATGSRAGLLAVLLEVLVLLAMLIVGGRPRLARVGKTLTCALLIFAVGLLPLVLPQRQVAVIDPLWRQAEVMAYQVATTQESVGVRWALVQNGLDILRQTHGLGVGSGNAVWWMENRAKLDTSGVFDLHNWWLDLLVVYGIPIAALFCVFYLMLFARLAGAWKLASNQGSSLVLAGSLLGLAGMSVATLGPSSVLGLSCLWLLLGTALAAVSVVRLQGANPICTY